MNNDDITPAAMSGSFVGAICLELLYGLLLWWVLGHVFPLFGLTVVLPYRLCLGISVLIRGLFK